jgi:predicted nuclease of predicted toxin-antitoxin system
LICKKKRGIIIIGVCPDSIILRGSVMNRLKKAGFILLAVFCIAMFYGCTSQEGDASSGTAYPWELGTFEGLNARTEWRIIQDYFEQFVITNNPEATVNDVIILKYYGTYNGLVVITTNFDTYDMAVVLGEEVDGVHFVYCGEFINTWHNGRFFNLAEASAQGYLTQDNLKQIKKNYEETD